MPKLTAAVALALLLMGLLTQCSWRNFEQREEYVYHAQSGKARFNPYYASERLLTRLGLKTHSVRKLPEFNGVLSRQNTDKFLGPRDAVILSMPGYNLSEARVAALLDWVNSGGALIFSPDQGFAIETKTENYLLNALGVDVNGVSSRRNTEIQFTDAPLLTVRFRGGIGLLDSGGQAVWQAGNGDAVQLLHYHLGDGAVTVLSDLSLFNNRYISEHDHADFLWSLLHLDINPQAVWLQFAPQIPSLWELIWQTGWMVITALVLLLIALAWAANQRLGPKLIDYRDTQRSLLEHIRASGWFTWRHGAKEALLDAARQRIRSQWQDQWQGHQWQGEALSSTALDYHALARQTGLDIEQIIAAFESVSAQRISAQEFTHTVKILQKIESTL